MQNPEKIRAVYGKANTKSLINKAIRAECAGGDLALDRLTAWRQICEREGWGDKSAHGTGRELLRVTAYRHILEIVDAMEDAVRETYDLPDRSESTESLGRASNRKRRRKS